MALSPDIVTCPGDCCRVIYPSGTIEEVMESLVVGEDRFGEAEILVSLLWPNPDYPQAYECAAFERGTRRCTAYDKRPRMCSEYPNYGRDNTCEHCTYDKRYPFPGVRYGPVDETGIFCDDRQQVGTIRAERMR